MATMADWLKEQFFNLVYLADIFCAINLLKNNKKIIMLIYITSL
jgi:hypothetical protein